MSEKIADPYARTPCLAELVAIIVAGLGHVVLELGVSEPVAGGFSAAVCLAFLVYLVWRARRSIAAIRAWGMRRDNFWRAVRTQCIFGAVAAVAILGYGAVSDSLFFPPSFWLTLTLYPLWGIAQQFALQNLIARNVARFLRHPPAVAAVSAALFSAAHYPRTPLVLVTLVSGFFFTLAYRRVPNLWAVGAVHGILGALAVYIILRADPGAAILDFLRRP